MVNYTEYPILCEFYDNGETVTIENVIIERQNFTSANHNILFFALQINHKEDGSYNARIHFLFDEDGTDCYEVFVNVRGANIQFDILNSHAGGWQSSGNYAYTPGNWYYVSIDLDGLVDDIYVSLHVDLDVTTNVLTDNSLQNTVPHWKPNYITVTLHETYANMGLGEGISFLLGPMTTKFAGSDLYESAITLSNNNGFTYLEWSLDLDYPRVILYEDAALWFNQVEVQEKHVTDLVEGLETEIIDLQNDLAAANVTIDILEVRLTEAMVTNVANIKADTNDILSDLLDLLGLNIAEVSVNSFVQLLKGMAEGDYR